MKASTKAMMTRPPIAPPIVAPTGVGFAVWEIWDTAGVGTRLEGAGGLDGDAVGPDGNADTGRISNPVVTRK
jgi:hypothetical protein